MKYEELLKEYEELEVREMDMTLDGLYADGCVAISSRLDTNAEKACILAEEIGHHLLNHGNILDQSMTSKVKQENVARNWAYEKLVPLDLFIEAYENRLLSTEELIEHAGITCNFFQ